MEGYGPPAAARSTLVLRSGGRRGVCVSLVSQAQAEKETTARTRAASNLAGLAGQARKKRELLVRAMPDTKMAL
jgi:hypothetical protein